MNRAYHNRQKQFFNKVTIVVILSLMPAIIVCSGLDQPVNVEATIAAGIAATQQAEANIQATVEAGIAATQAANQSTGDQLPAPTLPPTPLLAGETPSPVPVPPTPIPDTPTSIPDPQRVRSVILNEITGAISQDLTFLKSLYAPNAVVIDHKATPDDPDDDTTWRGWINIERRYLEFFAAGFSSLNLVDLSIQVNGDQAVGTHQGVVLDGVLYPDEGVYILEKLDGQWLITQLEFGNTQNYAGLPVSVEETGQDDGLYILKLGAQHRYEEPWGWDGGDPCEAWATGNFDDTQPHYRGFNVELLLTNASETKLPDNWPVSFTTARGKSVKACFYGYEGAGPPPGATSSVTFFTVVEKGDFVKIITFSLDDQTIRLCLDGEGGWWRC
jgi:hypothetical protein